MGTAETQVTSSQCNETGFGSCRKAANDVVTERLPYINPHISDEQPACLRRQAIPVSDLLPGLRL